MDRNKPRAIVLSPEGMIDHEEMRIFTERFLELDNSRGPIDVYINSGGGDTDCGFALYDLIRHARNTVTTIGLGSVGSIAVLVLQAGDKRILAPEANLYLHETSIDHLSAPVTKAAVFVREAARSHTRYTELLAKHTGRTPEFIRSMCSEEVFLPTETALKLGFADKVLTRKKNK